MDGNTKSGNGNRLVIVVVAVSTIGLLAIFPPCRKNDVILNSATNRVEEISPWRGYVPIFQLPRPEGARGGNFFVAREVLAIHIAAIVAGAVLIDWLQTSH